MSHWSLQICSRFAFPHADHSEESHAGQVYTIQLQASNLVSGSQDKTIRIWDVDTQRLIRPPLTGHEASVICLLFDAGPDHNVIVSGSSDKSIIFWRFSTGAMMRRVENAHQDTILSMAWNERYLVTAGKDSVLKVWDWKAGAVALALESGKGREAAEVEYSALMVLRGHNAPINAVQMKGDIIVSASGDGVLRVWNIRTGEVTKELTLHTQGIACLAFNGRFVVSGSTDLTCKLLDLDDPSKVIELKREHRGLVRCVQILSSDGDLYPQAVLSGDYDGSIVFWERGKGEVWRKSGELVFGTLQTDDGLQEDGKASRRIFDTQADGNRLIGGGYGRVIEGWEFVIR